MVAATPIVDAHRARRSPAWDARLDLRFDCRDGRSVLAHNQHRGPLQVQKALYPEGPGVCHVAVLHPPGGIAAGDCLRVDAALETGARVVMTTPGAAKWYRSEGALAEQAYGFRVRNDAVLEWLPRETILFDGSRASMTLDVALDRDAKFFGWEILCWGRAASGETWQRGTLTFRTRITNPDGLIWAESADLTPDSGFLESPVGLAGCSVSGTFLIAGCPAEPRLVAECRATVGPDRTHRGVTALPEVLVARYLGNSSEEAFHWFRSLWGVLRPSLLGTAAHPPRLWTT
jgi:urease accessory protein